MRPLTLSPAAAVFSSLDLAMAYHQVPVAPSDIEKTAFITHAGLYEMIKMPFGLCNAPSTYQRLMSIVLRGLIARICLAYFDDVIVFSRRLHQHLDDLRAVFQRVLAAGLKLKPSKCQLFRDEVLYLGHVINATGIAPDPAKLRVLATWPVPEDCARFAVVSRILSTFMATSSPMRRDSRHRSTLSLPDAKAPKKWPSAQRSSPPLTPSNKLSASAPSSPTPTSTNNSSSRRTLPKSLSAPFSSRNRTVELSAPSRFFPKSCLRRNKTTDVRTRVPRSRRCGAPLPRVSSRSTIHPSHRPPSAHVAVLKRA